MLLSFLPARAGAGARPVAGRRPVARAARLNGAVPYATKLKEPEVAEKVEVEEPEFEDEDDGVGLTTSQVQAVMGVLCDETDIAELSVRLGSFELSVRRSLKPGSGGSSGATAAAASDPAAPSIPTPPAATAFASTASMDGAASGPATATATASASLDEDDEESTLLLGAPKVGLLRRGRYVKGKQVGKGSLVAEGDVVKKGQVLGFIEQLGTFVAIEAPQAGEIVEFLADEGDPVEYGEPVVSIAPFFGGHIIGDSKHA